MKLAVFGNSHVGAWQTAWPEIAPQFPDVDVSFFGVPEMIHRGFRISDDGMFAAPNLSKESEERLLGINKKCQLDLSEFDQHVWVGTKWSPEVAISMAITGDIEDAQASENVRTLYSIPFLDKCMAKAVDGIFSSSNVNLNSAIKPTLFGRPIYAKTCQNSLHHLYEAWRQTKDLEYQRALFLDRYVHLIRERFAKDQHQFLAPPRDLWGHSGATDEAYLAAGGGVVNPKKPNARGDHSHMNASYGARCMKDYLKSLEKSNTGS